LPSPPTTLFGTLAGPNQIVAGTTEEVLVACEEAVLSSSAEEAILARPAQQIVAAIQREELVVAAPA